MLVYLTIDCEKDVECKISEIHQLTRSYSWVKEKIVHILNEFNHMLCHSIYFTSGLMMCYYIN